MKLHVKNLHEVARLEESLNSALKVADSAESRLRLFISGDDVDDIVKQIKSYYEIDTDLWGEYICFKKDSALKITKYLLNIPQSFAFFDEIHCLVYSYFKVRMAKNCLIKEKKALMLE